MTERPSLSRFFVLLGLLIPACAGAARSAAGGTAWEHLWANRNPEARQAVRAALQQNPGDLGSQRAAALLNLHEDMPVAAAQNLRRLYPAAAKQWTGAGYWQLFVSTSEACGSTAALEQAAREVAGTSDALPILKDSARYLLARRADAAGRFAEADALRTAMGVVRKWRVVGPFANVSRSGFDRVYGPEREIKLDATYPGRDEVTVRWHALRLIDREGRCEVQSALGHGGAGSYYAVTAIQSPEDREVRFGFAPEAASKLWVNGRLLLRDPVLRSQVTYLSDLFYAPATLKKGWNTVLIKLAGEAPYQGAFRLRVTGKAGEPLPGLVQDPAQASGGAAEVASPEAPDLEIVRPLRPGAQGGDPEAWALISNDLWMTSDHEGATDAIRKALEARPNCAWLRWKLSQCLASEGLEDEARAEREQAIQANPRLMLAQVAHAEENHESIETAQYVQKLRALLKYNANSPALRWALSHAYQDGDLGPDCIREARLALKAAPGAAAHYRLISTLSELGSDTQAAEAAKAKAHPDFMEQLASKAGNLLFKKPTAAIPLYQRMLQLEPGSWGARFGLLTAYQQAKNKKGAMTVLRGSRQLKPQDSSLCVQLADLLLETGGTKEAVELYREAIRLDPSQVSLREKLQFILKEPAVIDLAPATPVQPILAAAAKVKSDGASVAVLLDEAREVVYPDYARVSRQRAVVKILDQSAAEAYQQFPLSIESASDNVTVETARLIKADGKVQDFRGQVSDSVISFPSLGVGDIIDVAYRVERYGTGGLARNFWSAWAFSQANARVKLSRFVLVTPVGMQYQMRSHGGVPAPVEKEANGWRVREWKMTDVEPEPDEVLKPGGWDNSAWLDISTVSSWKQIVEWYQDISQARCTPDAAIRAKALELTKDARTEEEKLRAIVGFVQDLQYQTTPFRMSAFVPTEGKQVLRERYGDCKDKAALLTAMLATVGIKSRMVLLSGRSSGTRPYLPSPRFNHAIAVVETSKGPLWVDATADQMPFGGLPSEDQQVPALIIDPSTTDLVLSPGSSPDESRMVDTHSGALTPTGGFAGSSRLEFRGNFAWMFRTLFRTVPQDRLDTALSAMSQSLMDGAQHEKGAFEALDDREKPLGIQLTYKTDRFATAAGNFLLARLPWGGSDQLSRQGSALLNDKPRQQDLEFAMFRGIQTSSIRLELPEGFSVEDLQPEVRREAPFGSFRFTYRLDGRTLVAEREMRFTAFRIPKTEAAQFAEFMKAHEQELRRQHVFKKR